jgi:hypothetical protein
VNWSIILTDDQIRKISLESATVDPVTGRTTLTFHRSDIEVITSLSAAELWELSEQLPADVILGPIISGGEKA